MPSHDSTEFPKEVRATRSFLSYFGTYEIIIFLLIVLSLIGLGITDFSPSRSHWYWLAMAPVFAAACLFIEWSRVGDKGYKWTTLLRTQLLHWAGLLGAIELVYVLLYRERLTSENTGLVILLLLALTTFLAGIHLGWHLCLLGIFLGIALWVATYVEAFIWVVLLVLVVAAGVGFTVMKRKSDQAR